MDERVKVYHKKNTGISGTRNYGLDRARGEYIGFVDSDDWIEPMMFEKLLTLCNDYSVEISECSAFNEYVDGSNDDDSMSEVEYTFFANKYEIAAGFLQTRTLKNLVWDKLFHRQFFEKTGFRFPEGQCYEDWVLCTNIIKNSNSVVKTSEQLYHYRQRNDSVVHEISMSKAVDLWSACANRYEELEAIFPECCDYMIRDCFHAINKMGDAVLAAKPCERRRFSPVINEMGIFLKEHYRRLNIKLSKPMLVVLSLSKYDGWPVQLLLSSLYSIISVKRRVPDNLFR